MKFTNLTSQQADFGNRSTCKGQAALELAAISVLLMILVFATIDIGRMVSLSVRMASVAREGGRTYEAMEMEADQAPNEIYNRMVSMLEPSEIQSRGQVVFSVLRRIDANDDTDYSDPDSYDDDYIEVEYQYMYYPGDEPSWDSRIGAVESRVAHHPAQEDDIMPLNMLRIGQTTICVEIFHLPTYITPIDRFLDMAKTDPLYDRAIF